MMAARVSDIKRKSPEGGRFQLAVSVVLAAGFLFAAMPSEAAHAVSPARPDAKALKEKIAENAAQDVEETGSIQSDTSTCSKSRQRLFVEGEGWIVRKVTTCY